MANHNDFDWERISELYEKALEMATENWPLWISLQCTDQEKSKGMDVYLLRLLGSTPKADAFFESLDQGIKQALEQPKEDDQYSPGSKFDKFRIIDEIGRGGMSRVFLCSRDDGQFDQKVALKIMKIQGNIESLKEKFRQEQQILAGFNHPNIAQLYDGGITSDGSPYMIMEYVEGISIDQYCESNKLSIKEKVNLFMQVCDALQYAHNKLVVHHDIKPANILVNKQGLVKLLDFGISHVLHNQEGNIENNTSFSGTLRYAAPEQFAGAGPSVTSDIYKMGLVLYRILTHEHYNIIHTSEGQKSIKKVTLSHAALASLSELKHQKPLLTGDLLAVFNKALDNDPSNRFITVSALKHDLQNILIHEPLHSHHQSLNYRLRKNYERNKTRVWLLAGFNIALAVVGIFLVLQYFKTVREKQRAENILGFVWNIFESVDPEISQGDTLTVFELMENSIPEIVKFKNEPNLQAELFYVSAQIYTKLGFWQRGVELYNSGLEVHSRLPRNKANEMIKANMLQDLALSHRNLTAPKLADSIIDISLYIHQKHPPLGTPEKHVIALNVKSRIMSDLAQYDQSIEYATQALQIFNAYTSDPHIEKVRSLTLVASALGYLSRYDEALISINDAILMIDQLEPGVNSMKLLTYSTYSSLLAKKGLIEQAIENDKKIYRMKIEVYGPNKPITLVTLSNMASKYFQLKDYIRSDSINLIALEHYRNIFGDHHNFTNSTLYNLGNSYYSQHRFDEALIYLNQSLQSDIINHGETHPYVAGTLRTIGLIHFNLNELMEAEAKFLKALEILKLNFGEKHHNIASLYSHMAELHFKKGGFNLSKKYFETAIAMAVELLGNDHYTTQAIQQSYQDHQKLHHSDF
jgi:eukaryotic-like serine/threonine-protein kinase